jgi:hypothetical protein
MYKVMVGPGDKVAPGDPLIVMIAMKMEYVIKVISTNLKSTSGTLPLLSDQGSANSRHSSLNFLIQRSEKIPPIIIHL